MVVSICQLISMKSRTVKVHVSTGFVKQPGIDWCLSSIIIIIIVPLIITFCFIVESWPERRTCWPPAAGCANEVLLIN